MSQEEEEELKLAWTVYRVDPEALGKDVWWMTVYSFEEEERSLIAWAAANSFLDHFSAMRGRDSFRGDFLLTLGGPGGAPHEQVAEKLALVVTVNKGRPVNVTPKLAEDILNAIVNGMTDAARAGAPITKIGMHLVLGAFSTAELGQCVYRSAQGPSRPA